MHKRGLFCLSSFLVLGGALCEYKHFSLTLIL